MVLTSLVALFKFFYDGFQVGGLLICFPYIIGLVIALFIGLVNKS